MADIAYKGPDGETVRIGDLARDDVWYDTRTDHWVVVVGHDEGDGGHLRHVPASRVYHVQMAKDQEVRGLQSTNTD